MKATKLICSQNQNLPIRSNCQQKALPTAVQDLADLLAEITANWLIKNPPAPHQEGQEKKV